MPYHTLKFKPRTRSMLDHLEHESGSVRLVHPSRPCGSPLGQSRSIPFRLHRPSYPSRSSFQSVPSHRSADEPVVGRLAACCEGLSSMPSCSVCNFMQNGALLADFIGWRLILSFKWFHVRSAPFLFKCCDKLGVAPQ